MRTSTDKRHRQPIGFLYLLIADITESNNNLSKLILYTAEQTVGNIYIDSNNSRMKKLTKPL